MYIVNSCCRLIIDFFLGGVRIGVWNRMSAKCVSGHAPNTIHRGLVQDFSESNFVARNYKIAYGPDEEFVYTSREKDLSYRLSKWILRFIPQNGERKIVLEIK